MAHHGLQRAFICGAAALLLTTGLFAQQMREGDDPLSRLAFSDPRLRPAPATVPIEEAEAALVPDVRSGWTDFVRETGGEWQGFIDRRSGRLEVAEGPGIPWIPGPGNTLSLEDIAPHLRGGGVDLAVLERIARGFLPRIARVLGVDPGSLALSRARSGQWTDHFSTLDFDVLRGGRPIEGARVVFRISQGNLVQFGTENLPSLMAPTPREQATRKEALEVLAGHVGDLSAADTFLDGGSLHLLPVQIENAGFSEGFQPDNGRGLALVWQFLFKRRGVTGTWRARVDAETGRLLEFLDVNRYAKVNGGVYPSSFVFGDETVLPMPFADVSSGGYTNAAGIYNYPGGAAQSTLNGLYVRIFDSCGPISKSASGSGRIAFGVSGGTDCATPGSGGAGNTHSSRTQFYHLNRAKEIARGWLPSNTWLNGRLMANVNIFSSCNAYWDYYSVNFFRSGGGCGNTGELAEISLHEYGHGLDSNDGNGDSQDLGTAETYGDFTAALTTHESCMGPGFQSSNCGGYGDPCTSCTGVRDIDWAKRQSNTPHTVGNFTQSHCPDFGFYAGPCGREGHCESYVSSEALWDLAARDLPGASGPAAWAVVERLWYLSRPTATSAFTCQTGTTPWTSNGCNTGSLWRTMRAVDDDDGNLANGTPHSCHLFAAFNRHGIACAADAGANVCFSGCTPPAVPALSTSGGDGQVQLSWSSAGAGVVYDVYKSELGCDSGFIKVASDVTGVSFTDTAVANGLTYSYQVIAHPNGNEACGAAPSSCQPVTPQGPPCTPPASPSGVSAQALGVDRIRVTWNAAAGATDYEIYRAAASGGPYTRINTVAAPATTWTDTGLAEGTSYYYVIRALVEECVSGNSAEASATTMVCTSNVLYSNDFETGTGLADWTVGSLSGSITEDWHGIQSCSAHSGSRIFRFGGSTCAGFYADDRYAYAQPQGTAGIQVPALSARTRLSFWHRWDFELGYDGGHLLISVDGGPHFFIPSSAILSGGYNDWDQFSGLQSSFINTVVDLDAACDVATGGDEGCAGRTIRVAFNAYADGVISRGGWFLDDVTVTACTPHGCTGAPVIGSAVAPGNNQARVSWENGSPASALFNVYRAFGTCASAGTFEKVAGPVPGFSHLDTVSGGISYAYRVAGLDPSGLCESDLSACAEVVTTGPCTLPPSFAGLASATDSAQSTCAVGLSWTAAASRCGGTVAYNVYRSTDPGFTPGPASLIASGLTGTSYSDTGSLTPGLSYFYVVRAMDGGNGAQDSNIVRRSASATGPLVRPGTLTETFEGTESGGGFDRDGWSHSALTGGVDWIWSNSRFQTPSHSWFSRSQFFTADRALVSPTFVPGNGTSVSFWHTYEFESCFDGGTLEISTDGGTTWSVLPDSAFVNGGFNGTLYLTENPIGGKRGWCNGSLGPLSFVKADLSAWAGAEARLRWHAGEDSSVSYTGWYVDSVTLANAGLGGFCDSAPPAPRHFHTLTPCRLVDTRQANGPLGGPALQPLGHRTFVLAGVCNIPATAKALSVNVTVVQPASFGHLALYPDGQLTPNTSVINFRAGQIRSSNAIVRMGDGNGAVRVHTATGGTVHFILDVNGYFE